MNHHGAMRNFLEVEVEVEVDVEVFGIHQA
jgi:hypothetical protein